MKKSIQILLTTFVFLAFNFVLKAQETHKENTSFLIIEDGMEVRGEVNIKYQFVSLGSAFIKAKFENIIIESVRYKGNLYDDSWNDAKEFIQFPYSPNSVTLMDATFKIVVPSYSEYGYNYDHGRKFNFPFPLLATISDTKGNEQVNEYFKSVNAEVGDSEIWKNTRLEWKGIEINSIRGLAYELKSKLNSYIDKKEKEEAEKEVIARDEAEKEKKEEEEEENKEKEKSKEKNEQNGTTPYQKSSCEYLREAQQSLRDAQYQAQVDEIKKEIARLKPLCDREKNKATYSKDKVLNGSSSSNQRNNKQEQEFNKRKQEYEQQQKQQALENEITRQNTEAAAQMGAAAIVVHYLFGKIIYDQISDVSPYKSNNKGAGMRHHFESGYGFSLIPYKNDGMTATIDLGIGYRYDILTSKHGHFGVTTNVLGGHLLEEYRLDYGVGIQSSIGSKVFKIISEVNFSRRMIKHSSWIDAGSNYENKIIWKYNRFNIGSRFSWKNQTRYLDFLFGFNSFKRNGVRYPSYRFSFQVNNRYKIFTEYARLASENQGSNTTESLPYFQFGFYRTWDSYNSGSLDYTFDQLSSVKSNNNWYISMINPVISWGEIQNTKTKASLDSYFNTAISLFTIEKELQLSNNFSLSAGIGLAWGRGFKGELDLENINNIEFFEKNSEAYHLSNSSIHPSSINTFSISEIDFPLGLTYYLTQGGVNRFWLGTQYQPSVNLGTRLRGYETNHELNGFSKKMNNNFKLGFGLDLAKSNKLLYRIGLYHIWTKGFTGELYDSKMRGLQFKFAIGF
ncbi:MAG: hypothetical protein COA32_03795 [Fluviicola sp.]|nr:MAG: hypothetical protein COA32_03795 [Fluviicola sp.]